MMARFSAFYGFALAVVGILSSGRVAESSEFVELKIRWPVENVSLPSVAPIVVQVELLVAGTLPPSTRSTRYCLTPLGSSEETVSSCTPFDGGSNELIPNRPGWYMVHASLRLCSDDFPDRCILEEADPVKVEIYESSGIVALEAVASAITKDKFGYFGPLDPRITRPNSTYFSNRELLLLSPSLSVTFLHQVNVRFVFTDKNTGKLVPLEDGLLCVEFVSGPAQNRKVGSCVTFSAKTMHDQQAAHLLENANLEYGTDELGYVGKSLFSWNNDQRQSWNRIVRGVVYTRVSFYEERALDTAVDLKPPGKTVSASIMEQLRPSIESKFETMMFANSWEYDNKFNPSVVDDERLRQRGALHRNGKGVLTPQQYTYMTVVWGNSYVRGVIALATSLTDVGSQFRLTVLIPRSDVDNSENGIKPSNLALLRSHEGIQDVFIVDDTGKGDCFFGKSLSVEVRASLCNSAVENFAAFISTRLSTDRLPVRYDPRAYMKLLAFGLTSFTRIGILDADSIMVNNLDDDLLQPGSFMGVGRGIVPGAYFVLKPNLDEMERMMSVLLRTDGNFRFAEMTFLNIYFGSTYKALGHSSERDVFERFPDSHLCAIMEHEGTSFSLLQSKCKLIDFASCNYKPWDALTLANFSMMDRYKIRFSGELCRGTPVKDTGWNEGVTAWVKLYYRGMKMKMGAWEDHGILERRDWYAQPHNDIMSVVEPSPLQRYEVGEENIRFNISVTPSGMRGAGKTNIRFIPCFVNTCIFSVKDLDIESTTAPFFVAFNWTLQVPMAEGQHALKVYCLHPGAFESGIGDMKTGMFVTLQKLSMSTFSCGSQHLVIEAVPDRAAFMDAQVYVSGGVEFASSKLRHTGVAQFHNLLRQGLRKHHRFLEIGCGTLNLARHLVPFLDAGKYVCVEPNEWLIKSTLLQNNSGKAAPGNTLIEMLKKGVQVIDRFDFNASAAISSAQDKFDFVYSHSVVSHVGRSQLKQYFKVVQESLAVGGVSIASLCLCFPCEDFASRQQYEDVRDFPPPPKDMECKESMDEVWVYPYVSWWSPSRLLALGEETGLHVDWRNDIRTFMMNRTEGHESHDWVVMTSKLDL